MGADLELVERLPLRSLQGSNGHKAADPARGLGNPREWALLGKSYDELRATPARSFNR